MLANVTLPESVPQQKAISAYPCDAMLRSLVDSIESALFVPFAQRIAELAGAAYVGPQPMDNDTLHYFREPVTGTTVALWDLDLTLDSLQSSMQSARIRFGVA